MLRGGRRRRTPRRQGPAGQVADRDVPRRSSQRSHRRALPVRRTRQRRAFPRLCRSISRADAEAGRRLILDNLGSTKERRCGRRSGMSEPSRVPAEILPRPQPHRAGLRQAQDLAPKGRGAKLRSHLRRLRRNPRPIPARRMRRILQERRIRVDPKAGRSRALPLVAAPYESHSEAQQRQHATR